MQFSLTTLSLCHHLSRTMDRITLLWGWLRKGLRAGQAFSDPVASAWVRFRLLERLRAHAAVSSPRRITQLSRHMRRDIRNLERAVDGQRFPELHRKVLDHAYGIRGRLSHLWTRSPRPLHVHGRPRIEISAAAQQRQGTPLADCFVRAASPCEAGAPEQLLAALSARLRDYPRWQRRLYSNIISWESLRAPWPARSSS